MSLTVTLSMLMTVWWLQVKPLTATSYQPILVNCFDFLCLRTMSAHLNRWSPDEMRPTHLAQRSQRVECHYVSDSSQPHNWVHSHVCFTQLSAEGAAQLTSRVLGGPPSPFHSSLSPFRVPAPADTAICSQVLTVVRFDCTILALFRATFPLVTTDNDLIRFLFVLNKCK